MNVCNKGLLLLNLGVEGYLTINTIMLFFFFLALEL